MYSSVGRKTTNLHPQLQLDTSHSRLKSLKAQGLVYEKDKPRKRETESGNEDFFFYNILDYNKEVASKLREVSYVPKVDGDSPVERGSTSGKVQAEVQARLEACKRLSEDHAPDKRR